MPTLLYNLWETAAEEQADLDATNITSAIQHDRYGTRSTRPGLNVFLHPSEKTDGQMMHSNKSSRLSPLQHACYQTKTGFSAQLPRGSPSV